MKYGVFAGPGYISAVSMSSQFNHEYDIFLYSIIPVFSILVRTRAIPKSSSAAAVIVSRPVGYSGVLYRTLYDFKFATSGKYAVYEH